MVSSGEPAAPVYLPNVVEEEESPYPEQLNAAVTFAPMLYISPCLHVQVEFAGILTEREPSKQSPSEYTAVFALTSQEFLFVTLYVK